MRVWYPGVVSEVVLSRWLGVSKKSRLRGISVFGSVTREANNSVCFKMINTIHANGSAFVGGFVRLIILPGVRGRTRHTHARSRLPRDTTNGAVVAARPGFIPGRTTAIRITRKLSMGVELISYIKCAMPKTGNCRSRGNPEVVGAP